MRRILALAVAILMLLSSVAVLAEEDKESGWVNILLLGGDSRSKTGYDRSDTMIILSINRDEGLVKMTSIMRDTWVHFPGRRSPGKINAATVYGGPELAIETVNAAFGTDIEDYVIVNMDDMRQIIDLVGGVDVEITSAEAKELGLSGAGMVHMDGSTAVSYCRIRHIDSDYRRVMRQQTVLLALADRAQNMDVDELSEVADEIQGIVQTSLDDDELEDFTMAFMTIDISEVGQFRVPADGTFSSGMRNGVWLIDANFERNQRLLHEFIYGEGGGNAVPR